MSAYLAQCLDSLVCDEAAMQQFEAIVVNDGSKDNSLEIALKYQEKWPCIKVIDKENGGHGSAWNVGVEAAEGEYLAFLDSDDWIVRLEDYVTALKSCSADIVFNDMVEYNEATTKERYVPVKGIVPGVHELSKTALPFAQNDCRMTNFHYCIYRTSLLKEVHPLFHEKTSYDDMILFVAPIISAKTFEYTGKPFYEYRIARAEQSMSPEVISRKIHQQEAERRYLIDYVHAHKTGDAPKNECLDAVVRSVCVTFYNYVMLLDKERRDAYLKSWTDYINAEVPEAESVFEKKYYESLPMPVYQLALKVHHALGRLRRALRG